MRLTLFLGLSLALATPVAANAYDDPKGLVEAIYQPYMSGQQQNDLGQFYSSHLKQLFADHATTAANEVDTASSAPLTADQVVDFNPFIDAQHGLLADLAIGEPVIVGDKALVTVAFHNFDQPTLLSLALVREADGWKVDDVTSTGGEESWMLSWLLKYDPWGL